MFLYYIFVPEQDFETEKRVHLVFCFDLYLYIIMHFSASLSSADISCRMTITPQQTTTIETTLATDISYAYSGSTSPSDKKIDDGKAIKPVAQFSNNRNIYLKRITLMSYWSNEGFVIQVYVEVPVITRQVLKLDLYEK